MDVSLFNEKAKPLFKDFTAKYSCFANGDFGDLERIEFEGFNKLGTVEFWSEGWVGIDIYDCRLDDQIMNILLSPEEKGSFSHQVEKFIKILMQDS
ncbi:hypothetical protein [Duffyella gerundensis]|uniref:hypothetical protein n=1 Tax=Duffyella TaxID=3026546 RepID=UPI003F6DE304